MSTNQPANQFNHDVNQYDFTDWGLSAEEAKAATFIRSLEEQTMAVAEQLIPRDLPPEARSALHDLTHELSDTGVYDETIKPFSQEARERIFNAVYDARK